MRNLNIAIGNSADSLIWNNKVVSWDTLCDRLTKTHVTSETIEQYRTFTKKEKNKCWHRCGETGTLYTAAGHVKCHSHSSTKQCGHSMKHTDME